MEVALREQIRQATSAIRQLRRSIDFALDNGWTHRCPPLRHDIKAQEAALASLFAVRRAARGRRP